MPTTKSNETNTKDPVCILNISSKGFCCKVTSVVSDSVRPHRWQPTRLRRPWDSPAENTGVGCHFLLHQRFLFYIKFHRRWFP